MGIGIIVLLILVLLLNLKQLKKVKPVVLLALIAVGFIAGIALSQNNSPVEALNQTKTQLPVLPMERGLPIQRPSRH